jgi:hypothetical protein
MAESTEARKSVLRRAEMGAEGRMGNDVTLPWAWQGLEWRRAWVGVQLPVFQFASFQ